MKNWYAYIQVNGEEISIFDRYEFPVTEDLYRKIQEAIKAEKALESCNFYKDLVNRAQAAFNLVEHTDLIDEAPILEDYDDVEEYLEDLENYNACVENIWDEYCLESLDIYDPGSDKRFKKQFVGNVYPDFVGEESFFIETDLNWNGVRSYMTILFDGNGMLTDIVDIGAEGMESECVNSSSWGNAYPDYEALEEMLEEELGYPDENACEDEDEDEADW